MENMESVIVSKGTHPLLTVLLCGMVIVGVVTSGSYFSKQRAAAREVEDGLKAPLSTFAALGR